MNETPFASNPGAAGGAGAERRSRRLWPPPVWLWALLAGVLAIVLAIVVILLLWDARGSISPSPSAPSGASASPTPSATVEVATPTQTVKDVGQGTFDSAMLDWMATALDSQNTAVLDDGGTFSDPLYVVVADTGAGKDMTPYDAVVSMDSMFTPLDPNPWDLALTDSVLAGYRSGPFGDYFPAGAIVARSHDGHVFSFIGHGSTITTMFMAASEDKLH